MKKSIIVGMAVVLGLSLSACSKAHFLDDLKGSVDTLKKIKDAADKVLGKSSEPENQTITSDPVAKMPEKPSEPKNQASSVHLEPGETKIRISDFSPHVFIKVSETGEVIGRYPLLEGKIEGQAIKDTADGIEMAETHGRLIVEGYFYDRRTTKKCSKPKKGYPYWGSFQWKLRKDNWKARGRHYSCGEPISGGPSKRVSVRFSQFDLGQQDSPFKNVNLELVVGQTKEAVTMVVAEGKGWKAEINDEFWCLNGAKVKLTYDIWHEQREELLTGNSLFASYTPFVDEQLKKKLLKQCQSLTSLHVSNYQKGNDTLWDTLLYSIDKNHSLIFLQRIASGWLNHIYINKCAGCHRTGAGGAPVVGEDTGWSNKSWSMSLADASRDQVFHFNNMHCPECTKEDLEKIYKGMKGTKKDGSKKINTLDNGQKRFADYANNPSPKSLIKSGLLTNNKTIPAVYDGRSGDALNKVKLMELFRDYVTIYDHSCREFLPSNAATYTFSYDSYDRTDFDGITITDVYSEKEGRKVRMEARFYPIFKSSPGSLFEYAVADFDSPLSPVGFSLPKVLGPRMNQMLVNKTYKVMDRTADTRALLAKPEYCTDPDVKQYADNLYNYLR